ncbi:MAG: hypothetical protein JWP35_3634 [Caulobacter sp.]|nr:hypothetical protein [Caulobacter sp.]
MKAAEALVAWTPDNGIYEGLKTTIGQVAVGPLIREGQGDWTDPFAYTGGAAYVARRKKKGWPLVAMVFIDFQTMVVRDGIDPQVAHEAFLAIDEYRQKIALDIAGAE